MLALMLVLHFIADFILQSREMGQKKSSELSWLAKHLGIQFAIFAMGLSPFGLVPALTFALGNTLIHGLIDWNIWKLYKISAHLRIKKQAQKDLMQSSDELLDFLQDYPDHKEEILKANYARGVKEWKYWEDHLFYTTIGFDQMLHMLTLVGLAGALYS